VNAEFLKGVRLFQGLDNDQLAEILMLGIVKDYKKDAVIFEEGAKGDRFYVIYTGSVRISRIYQHMGEEALTVLSPGDFLGEMSFFNEEQRSARAVAHEDAQLLEIRNADLRSHLEARPDVALGFLWAFCHTLSQRVRETNEKFSALFAISRVF
jgi:CRP/FNR family transcriptional regulator